MRDDLLRQFGRRLRWGMVGGGTDSLIGETHRLAARIDNRYDLVAGCLSIDPEIAANSAALALIPADRSYPSYGAMAEAEAGRSDGIEIVTICTPPHLHAEISRAFLARGIDVVCEKPMTKTLAEALELAAAVAESGRAFMLTHCYTGYPMVREARAMVAAGALGKVRQIETDFVAGSFLVEEPDPARKHWRFRPQFMGKAAILGEVGSHAHHMACYVTGRQVAAVSANMSVFAPGRETYDDAQLQLRFDNGVTGRMWCSFVAAGNEHGMGFRIHGDKGGLLWRQERPERLRFQPADGPVRVLTPGRDWLSPAGEHACRLREGHPEGYVLAFANLYRDFADAVMARALDLEPDPLSLAVPSVEDGVETLRLYEAANQSHAADGAWTSIVR